MTDAQPVSFDPVPTLGRAAGRAQGMQRGLLRRREVDETFGACAGLFSRVAASASCSAVGVRNKRAQLDRLEALLNYFGGGERLIRRRRPACLNKSVRIGSSTTRPEYVQMTWTTPQIVEICVGMEINSYFPAEL